MFCHRRCPGPTALVPRDGHSTDAWEPSFPPIRHIGSDESFTEARREFAERPSGAATTVFYELELTRAGLARSARLGEVEIRWVTPDTGESNLQHSTIFGQGDVGLGALNNPLLQMGALIALSSDRYSSLPYADASAPSVHRDLLYLSDELRALDSRLGDLDAYQDAGYSP